MCNIYLLLLVILCSIPPVAVISHADVPEYQKPEVAHLLKYIRTSDCDFDRNGKLYDGERAYEHVKDKYEYFIDDITSTETFIEYAATKSMMSGRYYLVRCGNSSPVKLADWLNEELKRYRTTQKN